MPPSRLREGSKPVDLTDADISFPLNRLFDRFNLDHIPERKRMDLFEHRDLAHIKHYKAAVRIFGGPLSRKRVMVAPPMETPTKHRLGVYLDKRTMPAAPDLNTELKPQKPFERPEPEEIVAARNAREREDNYKSWFKERQNFRNDLENMGLNTAYLTKKQDKTLLETRVLKQLKDAEKKDKNEGDGEDVNQEMSKTSENSYDSDSSSLPLLKIPAPLGIKILNQHLKQKKMRLIDLFTAADKNKDWKMSRDEFVKICDEKKIPISQGLLEDMLISLDMNLDENLDYKELSMGLELARRELREDRRKELSRENTKDTQKTEVEEEEVKPASTVSDSVIEKRSLMSSKRARTLDTTTSLTTVPTSQRHDSKPPSVLSSRSKSTSKTNSDEKKGEKSISIVEIEVSSPVQIKKERDTARSWSHITEESAKSSTNRGSKDPTPRTKDGERSVSPQFLEPPPTDTKPDRLILATDEEMLDLRKRDKEGLKGYNNKLEGIPPTILTGSKAIDDHSMMSTLDGETGNMINKFRQRQLQEYFAAVRLCKERGVVLNEELLERVLLFPPDIAHGSIETLRAPGSSLHSRHMADPPKQPKTPIEVKNRAKMKRTKSGRLLVNHNNLYPSRNRVSDIPQKMTLSTGRAIIRRKTDCWMTFEEYVEMTKKLKDRFVRLNDTTSNKDAFWPGHLLDKLRLCMPPYDQQHTQDKQSAIFTRAHRTPAVNYGYETKDGWQTNDDLYVQIGIHDPYKNKPIC